MEPEATAGDCWKVDGDRWFCSVLRGLRRWNLLSFSHTLVAEGSPLDDSAVISIDTLTSLGSFGGGGGPGS